MIRNTKSIFVAAFLISKALSEDCEFTFLKGLFTEVTEHADQVNTGNANQKNNGHADQNNKGHSDQKSNGHADPKSNGPLEYFKKLAYACLILAVIAWFVCLPLSIYLWYSSPVSKEQENEGYGLLGDQPAAHYEDDIRPGFGEGDENEAQSNHYEGESDAQENHYEGESDGQLNQH